MHWNMDRKSKTDMIYSNLDIQKKNVDFEAEDIRVNSNVQILEEKWIYKEDKKIPKGII